MNETIKLYPLNEQSSYQYCAVLYPFRFFYNLSGDDKTPQILEYWDESNIPDYILYLLNSFYNAYNIYKNEYKFDSPLEKGIYFKKGAKFIDCFIAAIPVQKGLVAAELIDNGTFFTNEPLMQGKAIRILLDNNLVKNTATPIHELFHVFQYNCCSFNNMWFMEGLARWSQNLTHKRKMVEETLPQTFEELEFLMSRAHDSEYFWRKLFSYVDDERVFIKLLLDESHNQAIILEESFKDDENYQKDKWTNKEKKDSQNNKYIFQAILNSFEKSSYIADDELSSFIKLIQNYIKGKYFMSDTPQVQRFLKVLQKCDKNLVEENDTILYSKYFDVKNKKLKVDNLNCMHLAEDELDSLNILRHIEGDLTISSNHIENLNSFNYLKSVKKLFIKDIDTLQEINGFNALREINSIEISGNKNLEEINGFNVLFKYNNSIDGFIRITKNKKLKNVSFLKGIKKVGSSFYLHHNSLETLEGLEFLEEVYASLSVSSNKLEDISALSNLKYVYGMLGLAYNNLKTLDGLENLELVKTTNWNGENRTISIHANKNLYDISGLKNIVTDENYIIFFIDSPEQYTKKPQEDSNFHNNILEIYNVNENKFIPTYKFVDKSSHDYKNFGKTTHSKKLTHLFDFELKSNILVISFSGFNGWLGGLFNSRYPFIIGKMSTHKIFIMDKSNSWYHNGIDNITKNIEDTISLITNIVATGQYSKILCIGASMGGYMALLTGKLINATNIVAFSPQTFLDINNREKYGDTRWSQEIKILNDNHEIYLDLEPLYKDLDTNTKVEIHYSTNVKLDEIHANHIDNKNINKIGYADSDHYLAVYLHKKNMLETLILNNLGITQEGKKPKILFGHNWINATSKCDWMESHNINYGDIDKVIEYGVKNNITILFANNYKTQIEILKHSEKLKNSGFKFIVNNEQTLQNLVDKQLFYDVMVKNNFVQYVPKYYEKIENVEYPCMVKIKSGGAGRGMFIAKNQDDLKELKSNMIMSEYLISNSEYATSIFSKDGKILKHITFEKTSSKDIYIFQEEKNIQTKRVETQFLDIFEKIVHTMGSRQGYCQCSINYKIKNNIPKIFEINPRIGYTLAGFCDDFKEMMDLYIYEATIKG